MVMVDIGDRIRRGLEMRKFAMWRLEAGWTVRGFVSARRGNVRYDAEGTRNHGCCIRRSRLDWRCFVYGYLGCSRMIISLTFY